MLIYIAGPLSADDPATKEAHLCNAMEAALEVREMGHAPLLPHLSEYLDAHSRMMRYAPIAYEDWLKVCMEQLEHCDALLFLGSSPGADRELARAKELGMPVYRSLEALERHEPEASE